MDNQSARDRADALLTAWNRRDYGEVASHLSPDVVLVDHTRHRTSTGSNGYIERFKRLLDACPDMQGETTSVLVEGNLLVQEKYRGAGTQPAQDTRVRQRRTDQRADDHASRNVHGIRR